MASDEQEVEHFKAKLYSNFRETGLMDNLKAQLRYKLLEKLQKKDASNKENIPSNSERGTQQQKKTLLQKLIVSLVSEFMQKSDYNYSNAVFLPEAGFSTQALSRGELIDIMKADRIIDGKEDKPLLDVFIDYVWNLLEGRNLKVSEGCQTDFDGSNLDLEQKLRNVDYQYHIKHDEDRSVKNQGFDERFLRVKREYEAKMKTDLEAEIARIKDFEIASIRIDEAEKYRIKMEQYREELEKMYLDKVNKLRERERDTIERCKQQIKNLESASYEHRQKVLKDLEIQKLKEHDWESHHSLEKDGLKSQKDRIRSLEQDLLKKQGEILAERERMSQALQKSKEEAKKELLRELDQDRINIHQMKANLEIDAVKIEQYKEASESYRTQNERLLQENNQLMEELQSYRNNRKESDSEVARLHENIESLKQNLKREEEHLRRYEQQVQTYAKENEQLRGGLEEYSRLLEQKKTEVVELNQRHIRDIEYYQQEIEKVDKEKEELKRAYQEAQPVSISQADMAIQKDLSASHIRTQPGRHVDISVQKDLSPSYVFAKPPHREESPTAAAYNNNRESAVLTRSILGASQGPNASQTQDDPMSRFQALSRELDELKRKREDNVMGGYFEPIETRKVLTKPIVRFPSQSSPKFQYEAGLDRDRVERPQADQSGELQNLQSSKRALIDEINTLIMHDTFEGKNFSKNRDDLPSKAREESPSVRSYQFEKPQGPTPKRSTGDDQKFDEIFDKYSDKLTSESHQPSGFERPKSAVGSRTEASSTPSNVQNMFKIENPKQGPTTSQSREKQSAGNQFFEDLEDEQSRGSTPTEDQPKPFMFKNKKEEPKQERSPAQFTSSSPKPFWKAKEEEKHQQQKEEKPDKTVLPASRQQKPLPLKRNQPELKLSEDIAGGKKPSAETPKDRFAVGETNTNTNSNDDVEFEVIDDEELFGY